MQVGVLCLGDYAEGIHVYGAGMFDMPGHQPGYSLVRQKSINLYRKFVLFFPSVVRAFSLHNKTGSR